MMARGPALTRLTLAVFGLCCCMASAQELQRPIPPQPLADALDAFMADTGLQLVYPAPISKGLMSPGAPSGRGIEDSLRALLKGTGLTFAYVNDRTITILDPAMLIKHGTNERLGVSAIFGEEQSKKTTRWEGYSANALRWSGLEDIEQVVITGSHITGEAPVGAMPIIMTRQEIERAGFSTVQDVIRSLPQNFNGGPSEDTKPSLSGGTESIFNTSFATGANLRGLGAGSTLVLLNGRRLAPGAAGGRFVDLTGLPVSAVERVEIFPDGASAIYGADAVGGVLNVILRDDYTGQETTARLGSATDGMAEEVQAAQVIGRHWDNGSGLLSFEYYERDALPMSARPKSASSDLRPFGGTNFDYVGGNPGNIIVGTQTWAIPKGQDGRSLEPSDFEPGAVNYQNRYEGSDLLPAQRRWSAVGTLRRKIGDQAEFFTDALISERDTNYRYPPRRQVLNVPSSNPFFVNPGPPSDFVQVHYGFDDDFGPEMSQTLTAMTSLTAGAHVELWSGWRITGYTSYAWYREKLLATPIVSQTALNAALADPDPYTAFNPFGDGSHTNPLTLAAIRDEAFGRWNHTQWTGSVLAEGSVGGVKFALGADFRAQGSSAYMTHPDLLPVDSTRRRDVSNLYGEVLIPLVDEHVPRRWAESARLSLAMRHENYSDFGSQTMPRIGVEWAPFSMLSLRGNWSKSFKAPNLVDLDESVNGWAVDMQLDPSSPTGRSPVLIAYGNNADLKEETASTWSFGADFTLPGRFSVGLTYFNIDFEDRVERIDFSSAFLIDPALAAMVTYNPSSEQLARVCKGAGPIGFERPDQCSELSVVALVDMRLRNVAAVKTSGVDLTMRFQVDSHVGFFEGGLDATYLLEYEYAQFHTSPLESLLDTPGYPLDFRLRASLSWNYGSFGASTYVNFADAYRDTISTPHRRVRSWTTLDVGLRYGVEGGSFVSLNVQNVFDESPPFVNNPLGFGYDLENADLMGRFFSLTLRKHW